MSRYPIYRNLSLDSDGVSKVNSSSIGEITVVPQDYPCPTRGFTNTSRHLSSKRSLSIHKLGED